MSSRTSLRGALVASVALGAAATAVVSSPSVGAQGGTASKAFISIPSGGPFTAGEYSVAATDVSLTSALDNDLQLQMVAGGKTFTLALTPNTTATVFPAGATEEPASLETADATHAAMTLVEAGGTACTTPTGSFTIADLAKTAATVDSVAVRFSITCGGAASPSATGTAFVNQPVGPLGGVTTSEFVSMPPVRLLDTRTSSPLTERGTVDIDITANSSGVPANATAVVVNLTGVAPSADTFFTLFPKGQPPAVFVSNLNPRTDDNVANLATVRVGADNSITLYNDKGTADAVLDVVGYYLADDAAAGNGRDRFSAVTPVRKLDTREAGQSPLAPGESRTLDLGITTDAAVLNVTVTAPTEGGFLTVFPDNVATPPTASNINFVASQTIANLVVVKLDAGKVKLFNPVGTTHVVVDLVGTYTVDPGGSTAGRFVSIDPLRVYDSRDPGKTRLTDGETRPLNVLGLGGKFAFEYGSFVANMTATNTSDFGFLTAFAASEATRPFASNLNWNPGETRPNQIYAGADLDGLTAFYNEGGDADLIVDVAGYFTQ
jgi:hypothetical protein